MRIAHISDLHIRNLKMHDEYRRVFANLCEKLEELKVDRVVNTGDTGHTKTQISPEFVDLASWHIRSISRISDYDIILGNHDLNLMNLDRQDSITPIIENMREEDVHFYKKSGRVSFAPGFNYWVFSLADQENYPRPSDWAMFPSDVNIGLFHGSIRNCVTDSNWRMTQVEHDIDIFDGLDYVLMGDIHKQQFFRDRRVAYAGSLIQQNFGEEVDKGFLLWDIEDKDNFEVRSISVKGSRKFYTLKLNTDLTIPNVQIESGSRIRISPPESMTLVKQKEIERDVKKLFCPHDVITLAHASISTKSHSVQKEKVSIHDLRQINVQENLIADFLKGRSVSKKVLQKVFDLNRKFQLEIEKDRDDARDVSWKINKVAWSNLFNYGEDNYVDFSALGGLIGIFAPNSSGKSNFIDVLLETFFDKTTKGVSKNILLINDNKQVASAVASVNVNGQDYLIERSIERIKYGQRKFEQEKEWGKTTVKFSMIDEVGDQTPLIGDLRPETERNIKQRLGTFDDFMLTSLCAQWNPADIISCKETKRKEILYRFLNLDDFERKCHLAKDDGKKFLADLDEVQDQGISERILQLNEEIADVESDISAAQAQIDLLQNSLNDLFREIAEAKARVSQAKVSVSERTEPKVSHELEVVGEEISRNESQIYDSEATAVSYSKALADLFTKLELLGDISIHQQKIEQSEKVKLVLDSAREKLKRKKYDLEKNLEIVSTLDQVPCGESFPSCKFLVNAFDAKKKLSQLKDDVIFSQTEVSLLESEISDLQRHRQVLDVYRRLRSEFSEKESSLEKVKLEKQKRFLDLEELSRKKSALISELGELKDKEEILRENKSLKLKVTQLESDVEKIQSEIGSLRHQKDSLNRKVGSSQSELKKLIARSSEISELRDTCEAYELYADAMGKDGIPLTILTERLPLINDEINKILSTAADFSVSIEHDVDEQSIRFYLQYGEYKSRVLELAGGAEKFLASIAIRMALLNVSNLPKTNVFIIDEGFGKLDPKNMESIQLMFDYLKTAFDHVIVISHVDVMKDMVDNSIELVSDEEGYAHIAIGE